VKVWADACFGSQRAGTLLLGGITILNAGLIAMTAHSKHKGKSQDVLNVEQVR
jgi:hypothetical protein